MRDYICGFFAILFIINLVSFLTILSSLWSVLEWWQTASYILSLLTGFFMVLISYWVMEDEEEIKWLQSQIDTLHRQQSK